MATNFHVQFKNMQKSKFTESVFRQKARIDDENTQAYTVSDDNTLHFLTAEHQDYRHYSCQMKMIEERIR